MRYWVITKKNLVIAVLVIAAIIFALFLIVGTGPISSVAGAKKQLPIYSTKQDKKIASFSFDAAWGNEDTQQLIEILAKYKVKATFFVVGSWVDRYPESVKALSDAGHEIQNHSNSHKHMPKLSRDEMAADIKACNDKIEKITGKRPILFRPPYGDYSDALLDVLKAQGMYCIQWDVDSLDWKDKTADYISQRVVKKTSNGSIILFHNAAKNTPAALPSIIEKLQADGFSLLPISQQIYKDNFTIDHEGRQVPIVAAVPTTTKPKVTTMPVTTKKK